MNVMTEQTLAAPIGDQPDAERGFSRYQSLLVALLAFVQFTVILDFTIMSPLGAIIMPALGMTPTQFGVAVSAYAFSAGISGILSAGFADRFDRKRLLLFFYAGFTLGTALCALAPNYHLLLLGRIVTGLFGGVIGAVVLAITTDLFSLQQRGRVMGFVQTAFAASQVLGIPAGLFLSNHWSWHVAFGALVGLSISAMVAVMLAMKPVDGASAAQAGQDRVPASGRDRRTNPIHAGLHGDDVAGDRRLHADAVRQRLHRAQSRHRHHRSADDLSGLRPVQHFHRPAGRTRHRCLRQISDVRLRQHRVGRHGADLHASRTGLV